MTVKVGNEQKRFLSTRAAADSQYGCANGRVRGRRCAVKLTWVRGRGDEGDVRLSFLCVVLCLRNLLFSNDHSGVP